MIKLSVEPDLFATLHAGFEVGVCDEGPIEQEALAGLRLAFAEAAAKASLGEPISLMLESSYELFILADCFEIGADMLPDVTEQERRAILALFEQARPPA